MKIKKIIKVKVKKPNAFNFWRSKNKLAWATTTHMGIDSSVGVAVFSAVV